MASSFFDTVDPTAHRPFPIFWAATKIWSFQRVEMDGSVPPAIDNTAPTGIRPVPVFSNYTPDIHIKTDRHDPLLLVSPDRALCLIDFYQGDEPVEVIFFSFVELTHILPFGP